MAFPSAAVTTSGTTFSGLGGLTGVIEALITANLSATAAPTAAPTLAANADAGSTLPSATYYVKITETNAFGETTASPISAGQAVVSGTSHLTVTFPSLKTGNTARNVYVGTASNGSDSKLAASGVTASSVNITAPLPTNSYAVSPPTVNTTGLTYVDGNGVTICKPLELLRAFERGNGQVAYNYLARVLANFESGEPVPFQNEMMKLYHARGVFALLLQACNEIGTLIDANPGTLTTADWGAGLKKAKRTQP